MTQGGEVDRWLLSEMGRAAFAETAASSPRASTTPSSTTRSRGCRRSGTRRRARLTEALRKRARRLPRPRREFYERLARRVDVHATDARRPRRGARAGDGRLELEIGAAGAPLVRADASTRGDARGPPLPLRREPIAWRPRARRRTDHASA